MATPEGKVHRIVLKVFLVRDGDYFVAYCPALELSSYDTTENGAKKSFDEALRIFVEDTERKGTLEKVLLGLGWTLKQKPSFQYQPPKKPKRFARTTPIREIKEYIPIQAAIA
jgi:hypothetical protein